MNQKRNAKYKQKDVNLKIYIKLEIKKKYLIDKTQLIKLNLGENAII